VDGVNVKMSLLQGGR